MRLPQCPEERGAHCWQCSRNRREGLLALAWVVSLVALCWWLLRPAWRRL